MTKIKATRRDFLKGTAATTAALTLGFGASGRAQDRNIGADNMKKQPNVVIIMTDQQRADLCRREGYPLDTTPFLDQLASQGTWFNRACTSMPICVPARVSMLTGRYPSATRVRTNHNILDANFNKDLFDVFRENGYASALVGKNHSHLTPAKVDFWYQSQHLEMDTEDRTPAEKEFDDFLKTTHHHLFLEPTPFPLECQIPYRLVSSAQKWIESVKDQPFLLWLSFPEPHNPYQVPEPYYSMFPPDSLPDPAAGVEALEIKGFKYQWCRNAFMKAFPGFDKHIQRARSNYMGMLRMIDDQVKRFVQFLDDSNLRENTIIIMLSDHGDFVGDYGLMRKGPELGDQLTRVPMLFTGPGIRSSSSPHPAHISIVDIMPTLCEAANIQQPVGCQGRSLWPMLQGEEYPEEEFQSAYVEHGFGGLHYTGDEDLDPAKDGLRVTDDGSWGGFDCLNSWTLSGQMRMVRKGDWKLVFDMQGTGKLYNLKQDPAEITNLYGRPETADKCRELLEEMLKWRLRAEDPLPLPRRRYIMKRNPRNYWTP